MMIINSRRRFYVRLALVFITSVIPLFFLPNLFMDMKTEELVRKSLIEMSLTFYYQNGKEIKCYTENPTDQEGKSYVFLPSFAEIGEISAEIDSGSAVFWKDGESFRLKSGEKQNINIRQGEEYEVHFYNSRNREIGVQPIVFLKSGNLPTLYVDTRSGTMDKLDADKDYKEKAFVELVNPKGNVVFQDDIRSISGRGNHTFSFEKKSYQVRLSKEADLLGMGMSDTWILLCNVYDPTYIRNKLAYDMALHAGMPGSPKSEYIDVYFNGQYSGMYLLCEKVEIGKNRLEITDLEQKNRKLNGEVLDYADRFDKGNMKGTELAKNPADITGGYLIEHDYGLKFYEVTSGFTLESGEQFSLKNPAHASEREVEYISSLMQEIEKAVLDGNGVNPDTGKHFTEYIDLESWADKYLIEEITRNNGGGTTSSYFYKPKDSESHKVFGGPVWDYDKAFGRVGGNDGNTRDLSFMTLHAVAYTKWFCRLYEQPEFEEAVKREYREKFSDYLGVLAEEKIDGYLEEIEEAAVLDRARFNHVYRTFEDQEESADPEYVRRFIKERKKFLDEVWLEEKSVCRIRFLDENGNGERYRGVIKGECLRALPDFTGDGGENIKWRIEGTERFLTEDMPVMKDIKVYEVREAGAIDE